MSFFNSLQGNFKSSQEDEKLTFGEIRRDDETFDDEPSTPPRGAPPPGGFRVDPRARGGSGVMARAAGVPRDGRQRLRDDRAKEHALTPFEQHRIELQRLCAARRESIDDTMAWLLSLGRAHMELEREEKISRREHEKEKEKASSKAKKEKKSSAEKQRAPSPATVKPSLPHMEQVLMEKDEAIEDLKRQLGVVEEKYLVAFSKLSLADKKDLVAMFGNTVKPSTTPTTTTTTTMSTTAVSSVPTTSKTIVAETVPVSTTSIEVEKERLEKQQTAATSSDIGDIEDNSPPPTAPTTTTATTTATDTAE